MFTIVGFGFSFGFEIGSGELGDSAARRSPVLTRAHLLTWAHLCSPMLTKAEVEIDTADEADADGDRVRHSAILLLACLLVDSRLLAPHLHSQLTDTGRFHVDWHLLYRATRDSFGLCTLHALRRTQPTVTVGW